MTAPVPGPIDGVAPKSLDAAVLRIHDALSRPVGAGFLVAPELAVTCAHVISAALVGQAVEPGVGVWVFVDLPLRPSQRAPSERLPRPAHGQQTRLGGRRPRSWDRPRPLDHSPGPGRGRHRPDITATARFQIEAESILFRRSRHAKKSAAQAAAQAAVPAARAAA